MRNEEIPNDVFIERAEANRRIVNLNLVHDINEQIIRDAFCNTFSAQLITLRVFSKKKPLFERRNLPKSVYVSEISDCMYAHFTLNGDIQDCDIQLYKVSKPQIPPSLEGESSTGL